MFDFLKYKYTLETHKHALCTCVIYIIIDLHLITLICVKLLSISSYITIKMYFFDCIQRGGVACGEVKRGTVRFVFGTRSNSPSPTFLILILFIRCLLVGVREGLWVGISLSYKWKQIGVFFRRIVYVYELFSTWNKPYNGIKNQGLYHFFASIGPSLFTVDSWWS
jgi:hypothetical protein